jgi:UPF0716 protein FxsA
VVLLVLLVLFLALPVAEIYVIVQASHWIGVGWALVALVGISIVGASVVKRQGLRVWRRFTEQVSSGVMPTKEMADGVVLLVAGALLMTPGFITDAVGALLLLPPVRFGLRALLFRRFRRRGSTVTFAGTATYSGPLHDPGRRGAGPTGIIDVPSSERD